MKYQTNLYKVIEGILSHFKIYIVYFLTIINKTEYMLFFRLNKLDRTKMSQEGGSLTCTVAQEWLNAQGAVTRKVSHRSGTLQLIRDSFRNLYLEVRGDKSASGVRHPLKGMTVFNRYMTEGKASIKFNDEKCTLFISNAPSASLVSFLKLIFVKVTNQTDKPKNPLTERILGGVTSTVDEISPATNAELKLAKEKAIKGSRTTITTPSPSNVRKRKLTDDKINIPAAKKLYHNPIAGEMTPEQKVVLDTVLKGKSLFYTGSAGTGKSFLLKKIIGALPPDVTMATASTGKIFHIYEFLKVLLTYDFQTNFIVTLFRSGSLSHWRNNASSICWNWNRHRHSGEMLPIGKQAKRGDSLAQDKVPDHR